MSSLAAEMREPQSRPRPRLTAEGLLRRRAEQSPEALALADPLNRDRLGVGRSMRYREADLAIDALASVFTERGLKPGELIGIQLPNLIEQPLTMLAAWRAGLTVCALPMLWRRMEIAKVVSELKPCALLGIGDHADENPLQGLCGIAADEASVRCVLGFGTDLPDGVTPLDAALLAPRDPRGRLPSAVAGAIERPTLITFTARVGEPLLPVFRGEQDLLAQGAMTVLALSLDHGDTILNPYPLTGPAGLALGLMPWLISGGALLQHQPFDRSGFARQLLEGGATVTALPSAMLVALKRDGVLDHPQCKLRRLGRVWPVAELASAQPGEEDWAQFDLYPMGDLVSLVRLRDARTDPTLLPRGKIQVRAENGEGALLLETMLGGDCTAGQATDVKLRGPVCPRGSAGGPLAPDGQGFIGSGLHGQGAGQTEHLLKIGRDTELLSHGGFTIAAAELDEIYRSFSGFQDAACFARPDPILGDRLFAAVVPKHGRLISIEALHRYLHHHGVAPYKFPDRIVTVEAIPRDADGSVRRDALARD
ncbi:MAG: class I adenylate-forming enzyme family protein [Methyloceanibacter sp.]